MSMAEAQDDFPNGATRVFGLIGDPVAQVRAPGPLTARFRDAGINAILLPMHIRPSDLASAFAGLKAIGNFDGLIATVPHKMPMLPLLDRLSARASLVGAVNLCRREPDGTWLGEIVDGIGFAVGLDQSGFDPAGRSVLVIGCGGAGSAVAVELAGRGAALRLFDTQVDRADTLAFRLRDAGYVATVVDRPDPAGADLVVNATPLGMAEGDPLPLDPTLLQPTMLVAEVVMKPRVTEFLKRAEQRGCRVQLGEAVMLNQLDAMLTFFRGGSVDKD